MASASASADKDNAAKKRIIEHMNADHPDSIARYLEHYGHKSSWEASTGRMIDIDLSGINLLTARGSRERIHFSPKLTSFAQARERLVALDKKCTQALNRSDVTVKEFVPPTSSLIHAVNFLVLTAVYLAPRRLYEQDGLVGGLVAKYAGVEAVDLLYKIQPLVWWFLVVAHIFEAAAFTRTLKQHSVNPRSATYWLWCGTTLIEGFFARLRLNRLVKKTREAREKQKH